MDVLTTAMLRWITGVAGAMGELAVREARA